MTQIKLRRDTSANFTSKNPVLGLGEPAYEIDTKKLKIGDGTTAYTQLEYFSAGGGGSADIGAVLPLKIVNGVISLEVDGQTIQVVDGKLAASTNIVTTDTAQTITGNKTFRYIGIDDTYGGKTRLGDGQSKIKMAYDGQISLDSATILADQSQNWRVGRYNKAGLIYSASPLKRVGDGPTFTNYDILDSSNLGSHVDGTTITYADGKLTATYSGLEICDIGMALYVDETKGLRRYLNGQIVDNNKNTKAFFNRLLQIQTTNPDYFTTEENWQSEATLNIDGCVYKFVLNYAGDAVVSVRLPKYPDYVEINAGGTLPVVGNGMTLGITNGTQNGGVSCSNDNLNPRTGNYGLPVGHANTSGTFSNKTIGITTDASKSGIETTLKQTKLKLRYFIQVATGSETENNIVNDIELNNPYSLFDSKYSDHELNNLSWLKSEGQWNAKSVYPTAYDKLLKVYNGTETVEGLSVKLSTETYTDYDFVLNTADETFRLPLKNHTADDGKSLLTLYYYVGETVQNANLIDAGRIGEQLSNCLTRNNKEEIVSWGMPDYSAGIAQTVNNPYTMSIDGVVYYYGFGQTQEPKLVLNGVTLSLGSRSDTYGGGISGWIPMPKGNTYKFIGQTNKIIFYPLKGAK